MTLADDLKAIITTYYGALGGGGTPPSIIENVVDLPADYAPSKEHILVWIPRPAVRVPITTAFAKVTYTVMVRMVTSASDDRLEIIANEVRRVLETNAVSGMDSQEVSEEIDLSDRFSQIFIMEFEVTLIDDLASNKTAYGGESCVDDDAIHDNVDGEIHAISPKGTPVNADEIVIEDSAASWAKKRVALSDLPGGAGPGSGTQWTLPVWDTGSTLGDSMISQDAGGTEATIDGDLLLAANEVKFSSATIHSSGTEIHIHPNIGNADGCVTLHPNGTNTASDLELRNNVAADFGAVQLKIDGLTVSISSILGGGGTAPTTLNLNDANYDTINIGDGSAVVNIKGSTFEAGIESIITAELVDGQSIDLAIDALILTHKNISDAHHTIPVAGDFDHNDLANIDADDIKHVTAAQLGALHTVVVAGDLNHNDLANIDAGDINHLTDAQVSALHATYTDGDVESVITAELVDGQSIDLAIDALILTHKNLGDAHHAESHDILSHDTDATGAELTELTDSSETTLHSHAGGASDPDAIHDNVADEINQVTVKGTPVSADVLLIEDSAGATWDKKKITIGTLPAGSPSFGVPTGDIDIGDASAEGSSGDSTRADHQHQFSAPAASYPLDVAAAESDGTATTPARSDHVHAHGSGYSASAHHAATVAGDLDHNDLSNIDADDIKHITAAQLGALHTVVVAGDLNHNDLANIDAGDINHLTDAQMSALHATYTDGQVETVITAELVDGQSIDLAIDALISTHASDDNAHHEVFEAGDFTTAFAAESLANLTTRAHGNLSDAPEDAHHPRSHALDSASDHSGDLPVADIVNGTEFQVLKSGASAPAWADEIFTKGGSILSPVVGYRTIWIAPYACTITQLTARQKGGTNTVVNARINGTSQVLTGDLTLASADTTYSNSSFNDSSIASGEFLEIEVVTVGSATEVLIQMDLTRP